MSIFGGLKNEKNPYAFDCCGLNSGDTVVGRPQTSTDPDRSHVVLPLNRGQQNSLTGGIIKVSAANFAPKRDPFLFSPPLSHFSQSLQTLVGLSLGKGNTNSAGKGVGVASVRVMPMQRWQSAEWSDRPIRKRGDVCSVRQ